MNLCRVTGHRITQVIYMIKIWLLFGTLLTLFTEAGAAASSAKTSETISLYSQKLYQDDSTATNHVHTYNDKLTLGKNADDTGSFLGTCHWSSDPTLFVFPDVNSTTTAFSSPSLLGRSFHIMKPVASGDETLTPEQREIQQQEDQQRANQQHGDDLQQQQQQQIQQHSQNQLQQTTQQQQQEADAARPPMSRSAASPLRQALTQRALANTVRGATAQPGSVAARVKQLEAEGVSFKEGQVLPTAGQSTGTAGKIPSATKTPQAKSGSTNKPSSANVKPTAVKPDRINPGDVMEGVAAVAGAPFAAIGAAAGLGAKYGTSPTSHTSVLKLNPSTTQAAKVEQLLQQAVGDILKNHQQHVSLKSDESNGIPTPSNLEFNSNRLSSNERLLLKQFVNSQQKPYPSANLPANPNVYTRVSMMTSSGGGTGGRGGDDPGEKRPSKHVSLVSDLPPPQKRPKLSDSALEQQVASPSLSTTPPASSTPTLPQQLQSFIAPLSTPLLAESASPVIRTIQLQPEVEADLERWEQQRELQRLQEEEYGEYWDNVPPESPQHHELTRTYSFEQDALQEDFKIPLSTPLPSPSPHHPPPSAPPVLDVVANGAPLINVNSNVLMVSTSMSHSASTTTSSSPSAPDQVASQLLSSSSTHAPVRPVGDPIISEKGSIFRESQKTWLTALLDPICGKAALEAFKRFNNPENNPAGVTLAGSRVSLTRSGIVSHSSVPQSKANHGERQAFFNAFNAARRTVNNNAPEVSQHTMLTDAIGTQMTELQIDTAAIYSPRQACGPGANTCSVYMPSLFANSAIVVSSVFSVPYLSASSTLTPQEASRIMTEQVAHEYSKAKPVGFVAEVIDILQSNSQDIDTKFDASSDRTFRVTFSQFIQEFQQAMQEIQSQFDSLQPTAFENWVQTELKPLTMRRGDLKGTLFRWIGALRIQLTRSTFPAEIAFLTRIQAGLQKALYR